MDKEELTKYLNGLNDCWQFIKYGMTDPSDDQTFWDEAIARAEEIDRRHNNPFIRRVLIEAASEIDRERRRAKE